MLQIRLLGQFDLRLDGKRITISSRAGQSLLAYLALTAGTSHRREKLAGLLWPETSEESARKNLRQELWRIRKTLTGGKSDGDFLLADEFTITFNRSADYWLDASQLERPDLEIDTLSSNLSLYQGELLPGFFDEWVVLERERIQTLFETKMEQLLNQLVAASRWIAVQEHAERWLSFGNSPEPAYRALMLAHGTRGDIAKVSSVYQRCMTDLDEKLGLEPSPETRALYDGLLKGTNPASHSSIIKQAGTITFLFTDIEGSTNLLDKLGEQYASVLADHHKIMRKAIQKWNGHEVDTQGDAFFVTFTRAMDAIQCAAEAQKDLAAHEWPDGNILRVRMGLHTGEPLIASTGYVGMDVHRAARIGDAAHGGQVLLSHTTRELVSSDIPKDLSIRDLGEYRLKDMKFPTPVYQLVVEGLKIEFPPLRTKFTGTEAPTPGTPPFKGLQYFDEIDSELFFGREVLTAKLVNRLKDSKFLSVIIGASGSGKSSVVRAGVIPALRNGSKLIDGTNPPENSTQWQIHILTPTAHPLKALATELTRGSESVTATATLIDDLMQDPRSLELFLGKRKPQRHTLLVLDQFEELFTLCREEFEREAFIDNLLTAIHQDVSKITLIITLRADFYAHLAQYPDLRDAVAYQQEYIGPMTIEELRLAIEEPAKRGHWAFEPGLVDLILRDVGDEPGALPLLSHALLETWKRRAGHVLTLKGYADAGGVRGAIAHTAESVYQSLSPEEQPIARNIFLRLTELGEGTEDTRRRVSFDELMSSAENGEDVRNVLNLLANARLVTLGEDTAEVAHEALIREWPTLREWLNQDREGLQLHRRLTETAREWEFLERDDGVLYRGAQLAQAREWATLYPKVLNVNEQAFLDASNAFEQNKIAEREAQQKRELEAAQKLAETEKQAGIRLRIRNRVITGIGVVAVILAIIAISFSRQSSNNALAADENAQSALHAQATAQTNAEDAKSNAEKAQQIQAQAEADERIARSRELAAASLNSLEEDPERSILLALESVSTTRDTDGIVLRESLESMHAAIVSSPIQMTLKYGEPSSWPQTVTYSPDGKEIAAVGESGTVIFWNAQTGDELRRIEATNENDGWIFTQLLAYRPDGKWLVSFDGEMVAIYDPKTGERIKSLEGHTLGIAAVGFSRDGKYLASGGIDGSVFLWDGETGELLHQLDGHTESIENLTFTPGGNWLITTGDDSKIKIWDVQSGNFLHEFAVPGNYAQNLVFSPDGDRFMMDYDPSNSLARIWTIGTEQKADPAQLLSQELFTKTGMYAWLFSPDGSKIAGTTARGISILDANTGNELLTTSGHSDTVMSMVFSPDGNSLVSAGFDGNVKLWSLMPGNERTPWEVTGTSMVFQPDGKRFISLNLDSNSATMWDTETGEQEFTIQGDSRTTGIAFSPDGTKFATAEDNRDIVIWDAKTGEKLLSIPSHQWGQMSFSPDGKRLATGGNDSIVRIWNVFTGELLFEDEFPNFVTGVAFSPDNIHLAASTFHSLLKVWDLSTGELIFSLTRDTGAFVTIDYSPDGSMLVARDEEGHILLWDAFTGSQIKTLEASGNMGNPYFSPNGKYVVAASNNNVHIWDVQTGLQIMTINIQGRRGTYRFDPTGEKLYVTGPGGVIRIYLLDTDELLMLAKSRVTRSLTTGECQKYLHVDICPNP